MATELAPAVGFEPTTNRLTADRSTTELRWIVTLVWAAEMLRSRIARQIIWLRGRDLNPRPSGYEPDELPGCSTPRLEICSMQQEAHNATVKLT